MKERIKELYEQAHIERQQEYFSSVVDPTIKSVSVTRHFDPELFAKLIVLECADLVEGFEMTQQFAPDVIMNFEASSVLKEQFGVEE